MTEGPPVAPCLTSVAMQGVPWPTLRGLTPITSSGWSEHRSDASIERRSMPYWRTAGHLLRGALRQLSDRDLRAPDSAVGVELGETAGADCP